MLTKIFSKLLGKKIDRLPRGCRIVDDPKRKQNCFGYILGIDEPIDRNNFLDLLDERGYECSLGGCIEKLIEGDIVAYYAVDPGIFGYNHASVYIGKRRAIGRFGIGGQVIEHPLETIPDSYFHKEFGVLWNYFRKK